MSQTTADGVVEYRAHELEALLEQARVLLIDVREPMEYAAERIPGALLYPLSTFEAAHLPPDSGRTVVFTCAVGGRSLTAARMRRAAGHPAAHLAGGIIEWKAEGLPVIRGGPHRA